MDEVISIKIKILDKEYPLRIPAAEEELYRAVGKELNERCREFRENYGARADKQDILSMVSFVAMLEKFKLEAEKDTLQNTVTQKIVSLQNLLHPS
ncbi:cell division protein ZapA [Cytophagaceae bacterium DM2B3-1]|uniref:Cell division protein ZapA n=2 Tax=Xanthocytophaga TaxID=3078918 RepID=A0AAE3QRJ6_9BACT|nr:MULTISPECIES: cell division protein ZapA [Xanthocytophaga]MDJ1471680.1 cell division protein ZapA [Xanthocytophaga flavus]MDJ1482128.1 cell division protein ZapA [Xanthocytophaga flavus]MDJ1491673.1 cell division protein ZapA [Xanthocytophaga flavus]MDJ1502920.1 cell division protein ZapA [Xanthocytophaga agilis]